jgi:small subunit ribosomal protein S20
MANIKSAIKRIEIGKRNELRNKKYSTNIKTFTKKFLISLDHYKNEPSELILETVLKNLNTVYSKIDKATKVNVLHKNTASRKKAVLKTAFNLSKIK